MFHKTILTAAAVVAMSATAFAADLPNRKEAPVYVPPPPPIFTWTGIYIGGQVGYQWGTSGSNLAGIDDTFSANGVTGGAHIGYNYQISQFVVGLEGDVNGLGYHGDDSIGALGVRQDINGSLRGRVGFAWDRVLVYATGGGALGDFRNDYTGLGLGTLDTTRFGWTVGGGAEYAIDNNWSIRAEYRYTDYGTYSQFPGGIGPFNHHEYDNQVQGGFSYKFDLLGPAPVVAKF